MWTKTLTVKFKGHSIQVQVWLSYTDEDGSEIVEVQSMVYEIYFSEKITFQNRDSAYDFIKHYPGSMALAFVTREAHLKNAIL